MKPLLLNTRPENRASETTQQFENAGFRVLELPAIKTVPVEFGENFFQKIEAASHLMFSSSQTIHFLKRSVLKKILSLNKKVISIGPKTSRSLVEFGFEVCFESQGNNREYLGLELSKLLEPGETICHLCSHITELNPEEFERAFKIPIINSYVYTAVLPEKSRKILQKYCGSSGPFGSALSEIGGIVYYSSSAVRNSYELLKDINPDIRSKWKHFALGPSAFKTLKEYYTDRVFMAAEPNEISLIQLIKEKRNYE
ncbi:MAG: uroporphyrinogen-III synthase [Fibrobacterales bacterium]